MKPAAVVLFVSFAAALAACGDRQEAETPASEPVVEAPQADTTAVPPAPIADAPPAESLPPPVAPPETPSAAPATPTPAPTNAPSSATRTDSTAAAQTPKAEPTPAPTQTDGAAAPATSQDLAHGEQIYRKSCAFCHDRGTAGAPKVGDVQAWAPRIAQGVEVLYTNSIKGIRAMPPKGGNPTLSEADVNAAVDYLVAKAR